jgi:hypothetical protein
MHFRIRKNVPTTRTKLIVKTCPNRLISFSRFGITHPRVIAIDVYEIEKKTNFATATRDQFHNTLLQPKTFPVNFHLPLTMM